MVCAENRSSGRKCGQTQNNINKIPEISSGMTMGEIDEMGSEHVHIDTPRKWSPQKTTGTDPGRPRSLESAAVLDLADIV